MPPCTKRVLALNERKKLVPEHAYDPRAIDSSILSRIPTEILSIIVRYLFEEVGGQPRPEAYALSQTNRYFLFTVLRSLDSQTVEDATLLELALFALEALSIHDIYWFRSNRFVQRFLKSYMSQRTSSFFVPDVSQCTTEFLRTLVPLAESKVFFEFDGDSRTLALFRKDNRTDRLAWTVVTERNFAIEIHEGYQISVKSGNNQPLLFRLKLKS
tara:strand:- start:218 stop:859 length:642 start_codon:yes stop_codon:yes gene_type:complete